MIKIQLVLQVLLTYNAVFALPSISIKPCSVYNLKHSWEVKLVHPIIYEPSSTYCKPFLPLSNLVLQDKVN